MSKLHQAEDRALRALSRLERACQSRAAAGVGPVDDAERARLLHEIEDLRAREARLLTVVGEAEGRVDGAIGKLDQIAQE